MSCNGGTRCLTTDEREYALPGPISMATPEMNCRPGCGACCIAPSISSPIPGLPGGKPAGQRCPELDDDHRCRIFNRPERPDCCGGLQPSPEMCGSDRTHALAWLTTLEQATSP